MRWKIPLAASAVLLVTAAPFANAQVPVTVTMESEDVTPRIPVDSVRFFWPDAQKLLGTARRPQPGAGVRQETIGSIDPTSRFLLEAWVYNGKNPQVDSLYFDFRDTCTATGVANHLERIACSIKKRGNNLVCTAIYAGMNDPVSPCGSHSCLVCRRGVEICGANPQC